jgi:DNA invertase Pin-like site-specific DNA recombinase
METMKVCLYARVSMDEGAEDKRYQEPENQLGPLRAWAAALNWPIVAEYIDKASGGDSGRPEFRRMLDDARTRKFDVILIWKLDRFSRERMLNTVSYISELRRWGVGIKSQTESWLDTCQDNPIADVVLAIMAWAASEERRKISDRTKAGIARRRAIGQWKGGRPKKRVVASTIEENLSAKKTDV